MEFILLYVVLIVVVVFWRYGDVWEDFSDVCSFNCRCGRFFCGFGFWIVGWVSGVLMVGKGDYLW